MGGRQSNPVSNWFNDMADRARRAAEEAARRAREAAQMAMQQTRNFEENNNIIRIEKDVNNIRGQNQKLQKHINDERHLLWKDSRENDNKIFGLNQQIGYYTEENRKLQEDDANYKNIIKNADSYSKRMMPTKYHQDNILSIIDLTLNKAKLYESIKTETDTVIATIPELKILYSSDGQTVEYEKQKLVGLDDTNTILFFLYYILFIAFAIMVIFINKTMSKYSKAGIIILLLVYPFIIYKIQRVVYLGLNWLYMYLERNTYHNGY
jgi:hypothetical protein